MELFLWKCGWALHIIFVERVGRLLHVILVGMEGGPLSVIFAVRVVRHLVGGGAG